MTSLPDRVAESTGVNCRLLPSAWGGIPQWLTTRSSTDWGHSLPQRAGRKSASAMCFVPSGTQYLETKGEKLPFVLRDSWPRTREESNSLPSPRSISSYSILHAGTMQGDNILLLYLSTLARTAWKRLPTSCLSPNDTPQKEGGGRTTPHKSVRRQFPHYSSIIS
jgi:hypothetical protein